MSQSDPDPVTGSARPRRMASLTDADVMAAIAAADAESPQSAASAETLNLSVRSGSRKGVEEIVVHPGRLVEVDPVLIGFWDDRRPTQALDEVGRIMGESIRQGRPMHRLEPGWSSWHSYSRYVTAEGVLTAARFMKAELYDAGYRYIQLDGGWWIKPGSYLVNKDFPRGNRDFSNQITDMGLKFGLHISPLHVNPTDPYWKEHPDWLLSPFGQTKIEPHDDDMRTTKGMIYRISAASSRA